MNKTRTRMRAIYWIVIAVGSLLLGMYSAKNGWNMTVVGLWLVVVFLGAFGVEMIWLRSLSKKTNALMPLLRTDPDKYIEGIEALLGDSKSLGLQQTRRINLAAAYCEKEEYGKAVEHLTALDPSRIPPVNQGAYWADLALARFCLGQEAEAAALIDGQSQVFARMKDQPGLRGLAAVLSSYYAKARGDLELAWERYYAAREAWTDAATQKELDRLEKVLRKATEEGK